MLKNNNKLKMNNSWWDYCKMENDPNFHLVKGTPPEAQKNIENYCRRHSVKYDIIDDCAAVICDGQKWDSLVDWLSREDIDCFI